MATGGHSYGVAVRYCCPVAQLTIYSPAQTAVCGVQAACSNQRCEAVQPAKASSFAVGIVLVVVLVVVVVVVAVVVVASAAFVA